MNMKKLLPVVLSLSMLFGALPAPAFAAEGDDQGTQWSDGVWEGTGKGFGGDVGVQVTIENGAITAVTSPEHEGESFWDTYELDTLLEAIVTANSAEVDAISGATKSSNGVKEAVQLALNRAAGIPDPEPEPEKELDPTIFASGDGSESDPFVIETEEQLRAFAVSLGDAVTYEGLTVSLDADIDVGGAQWVPIGEGLNPFDGTFLGNGHTVSGMTMGTETEAFKVDAETWNGFFSVLSDHAVVRDLNLSDIALNLTTDGPLSVGGLAGYVSNSDDTEEQLTGALVDNCTVSGSIDVALVGNSFTQTYVGGISSYLYKGAIINCVSDVDITLSDEGGFWTIAGGLVGMVNRGMLANSISHGDVNVSGGMMELVANGVGWLAGDMAGCCTYGAVSGAGTNRTLAGALAGRISIGRAYHCYYEAAEGTEAYGYKDAAEEAPEGGYYIGGVVDQLVNGAAAEEIAADLNALNEAYPVDAAAYGVSGDALLNWVAEGDKAALGDTRSSVSYVRPLADYIGGFVLMNIPYEAFYAAEADGFDAVSGATLKYENLGIAGGSYHETDADTDADAIAAGVTFPVQVTDLSVLDAALEVTDETSKTINLVTGREKTVTATEVTGAGVLFCAPTYSWYRLSEVPANYKMLSVGEEGAFTFGALSAEPEAVEGVTGTASYETHHGNEIEIRLSDTTIESTDTVNGTVLTFDDGTTLGLPHVQGFWQRTQIGFHELGDNAGKTITNVRFITDSKVLDCAVSIRMSGSDERGYVLMNIPYEAFYAAEADSFDAITGATLKYENASIAGGSYHETDADTDADAIAAGVTFPVFVDDFSKLDAALEVKADDTKTINLVTGREKTITATEVTGADILFCAPGGSWMKLDEAPARYKTLNADGSYSAVSGRATAVTGVTGTASYETHHGNAIEIRLNDTTIESTDTVNGVVLTFDDGTTLGLPHVQGVWQRTQIGFAELGDRVGKTITNVRFITAEKLLDCALELLIKPIIEEGISAEFSASDTLSVAGIPADAGNVTLSLAYAEGRQRIPVEAEAALGEDGTSAILTLAENSTSEKTYTVTIESDKYAPKALSLPGLDPDPVESYVERAYEVILGRSADAEGAAHWTEEIANGASAGEIIDAFFASDEFTAKDLSNSEIVTLCYEAMLGREPDAEGLENWTRLLDAGYSTTKLVAEFTASPEFAAVCDAYGLTAGGIELPAADQNINVTNFARRLYTVALEREADTDGLNDWVSQILDGTTTPEDAAFGVVFSDEAMAMERDDTAFITMLYELLLGRAPESDEALANWVNVLSAGAAAGRDAGELRQETFRLFAASEEFKMIVESYGL